MTDIVICGAEWSETYATLHHSCFTKAWNESMMRQTLLLPGSIGFIAFENEIPVGLLIFAFSIDADIVTFGIIPEYRGKHISDTLMKNALDYLKQQGIENVFLEVAVNNPHAIDVYQRTGFETVGKRPNYYVHGTEKIDALIMKKELNHVEVL
ncbi:MAG: GNAT family N-acetyltransferase [Alphaproteobacteria bacterium]|nr:GNAT family N-acetyltransferase [Alphaproteobacteria bacterium]